jgi:hypothetical protein
MIPWQFPDGTELLIQWLGVLGETRTERPTGAVLPFRTVRRIGGGATELVDSGLYSISDFAGSAPEAHHQATLTYRRVMLLNQPEQQVDGVEVTDGPRTMKWTDTVWRSVTTYQVDLRAR